MRSAIGALAVYLSEVSNTIDQAQNRRSEPLAPHASNPLAMHTCQLEDLMYQVRV
jgi:hypothetical protein